MNGTTRVLEAGVIAKYILGDPMAPWHRRLGVADLGFIKKHPAEAKKFIAAYAKGIELVRSKPGRGAPVHEGLHRHRRAADGRGAARRLHALQRVHAEPTSPTSRSSSTCSPTRASSRRALIVELDALQGLTMTPTATSSCGRAPAAALAGTAASPPPVLPVQALPARPLRRQAGQALRQRTPAAGDRPAGAVHRLGPGGAPRAASSRSCCRRRSATLRRAGHRPRRRPAAASTSPSPCGARSRPS